MSGWDLAVFRPDPLVTLNPLAFLQGPLGKPGLPGMPGSDGLPVSGPTSYSKCPLTFHPTWWPPRALNDSPSPVSLALGGHRWHLPVVSWLHQVTGEFGVRKCREGCRRVTGASGHILLPSPRVTPGRKVPQEPKETR